MIHVLISLLIILVIVIVIFIVLVVLLIITIIVIIIIIIIIIIELLLLDKVFDFGLQIILPTQFKLHMFQQGVLLSFCKIKNKSVQKLNLTYAKVFCNLCF